MKHLFYLVMALLTATLVSVCPLVASESERDWEPPPPMPDEFDWIQLTSGEWLKGELLDMFDDKLQFDSDKLKLLDLKWEDVRQVRSAGVMQVMFLGRVVETGQLLVNGDSVVLIGEEDRRFERSRVIAITSGEPKEINFWSAKVTLGANIRKGNSDLAETNARVRINRMTVKNRLRLDYLGNYNTASELIIANNHRATFAWDKFLTDRFFVAPVFGEYFRDPFQNISARLTVGTGVGYDLIDTSRVDWRVVGGPAYQETRFDDVVVGEPESENTPALVVGTTAGVELSNSIDFAYQYRFQIVDETSGSYNHHMVTGLELELTRLLDFDITFVWDRIEEPRPNSDLSVPDSDDFRLILGLALDF